MILNMKKLIIIRTCTIMVLSFLFITSCNRSENRWEVGNPPKLDVLAIRLSKYKRELDKNHYSIHYLPKHPNTIVILARYNALADRGKVESVVSAAKDLVKRVAKDDYGIEQIEIEVDMDQVD